MNREEVTKWFSGNKTGIFAFFAGALATILTFTIDWRQKDIDYGELNLANCQELYQELRKDFNELKVNYGLVQEQVVTLQINQVINSQNSIVFSNAIDDLPFPYFVKTRDGTMVKLNKAYETIYLTPKKLTRLDYIDHTDYEIWTTNEANNFKANDEEVINKKKVMTFNEIVNVNGRIYELKIFKFPVYLNNSVIGVGGIVIPDKFLKS